MAMAGHGAKPTKGSTRQQAVVGPKLPMVMVLVQ